MQEGLAIASRANLKTSAPFVEHHTGQIGIKGEPRRHFLIQLMLERGPSPIKIAVLKE